MIDAVRASGTVGADHRHLARTLSPRDGTVNAIAGNVNVVLGSGASTVFGGAGDSVTAGSGASAINFLNAANQTFIDSSNVYADTIVSFDQAAGDRIHLTTDTVTNAVANSTQVNNGADTLVSLSDGSTILLKGVTHIDSSFFS